MSRFRTGMLAVWLATSFLAAASIGPTPAVQWLERSAGEKAGPMPRAGPHVHYDFDGPQPETDGFESLALVGLLSPVAAAGLWLLIPFCQRWALFFRLLD